MARWDHGGLTRQQRGYGQDWQRLRAAVLRDEPLCRMCGEMGHVTAATEVDHIRPFQGLADPLRLDRTNLRPLCTPCHRQVTSAQGKGQTLRRIGLDGWPIEDAPR